MKNIDAFETEAVVDATASVRITELPFAAGEHVRIRISREGDPKLHRHSAEELDRSKMIRERLKGSVLADIDPFGPAVPPEDWDAISGTELI